jgi:large subunit ribosomal protein L19
MIYMDNLRFFEKEQTKAADRPKLRSGDVVRVHTQVSEGDKTRLQAFEGTILNVRGGGPSVTFTVRRETGNFGVERIFPLFSPLIQQIEVVKRQQVRRGKLTYLRQAGRRRFKEDMRSMQRHLRAELDKKRVAEEAQKREEDKKQQEEIAAKRKTEAEKQVAEKQVTEEQVNKNPREQTAALEEKDSAKT